MAYIFDRYFATGAIDKKKIFRIPWISFLIYLIHTYFNGLGFLDLAKDFLIFAPSSCSSILVSKLKDTFIRLLFT